ncbi:MAG: CHASE2 domain-containing protein [Blastocatellia bacterium]|nr:CHASE2 domain-containing protein [Blastocatellia bacterium]
MILLVSSALVALVTWFAPGLSAASLNLLFRLRGPLPAPTDVTIVAIDDESLRRIGQWPWPRSVIADALDRLTEAGAGGVGLDIIYAEPTNAEEDQRLAASIARSGRVVLPAQLYETFSANSAPAINWLRPLPAIARAARALGHAHVAPGVDGMARSVQLSKADDRGDRLWAFGMEVVRVAEGIGDADLEERAGLLRFGGHRVPVLDEEVRDSIPGVLFVRPNETIINYAGPTRSFAHYSMADLLEGKIPSAALAGRIVLIGATAPSLGDTRVAPFMHFSAGGEQGGQEMPGVEIHANLIHTIRGRLSLRSLPEEGAFLLAIVVILCAMLTVRWLDGWRQVGLLALLLLAILAGSFLAFSRYHIIPPLVPMLTGFGVVVPLLLNRALAASRELDRKLAALVSSQQGFLTSAEGEDVSRQPSSALELPRSLAWKLRAVDDLTTRLVARMSFIDRILSSMGEGVLVSDLTGRILFANQEAMRIFGCRESDVIGAWFDQFLIERGRLEPTAARDAIGGALSGRVAQLEFEVALAEPQYYSLLLSALVAQPDTAIGVVALISDISRRVEMDRLKTETLQLVSHELRTPLTSIRGLSDVLLKFPVAEEQSREMIDTIHAESVRLGEMLNRYLDLTRLESGAQALQLAPVPCGRLIDDCIHNLSVPAAERRIRLHAEVPPTIPPLQADGLLLRQAVSNLLGNAIKYSPPDTDVTIAAELQSGAVAIHVRDQGFGVPPEARDKIFQKFYRLERDASSPVVGAGLGLPLVKEIAERHGGRVTLQNGPAGGSIFTLYLPLSV